MNDEISLLAYLGTTLMIKQKIINIAQAQQAYFLMKKAGRRLPWKDAENRLQQIEAGKFPQ